MNDQKHVVSEQRHKNMAAIHSKNTKPEIILRNHLHHLGFRFRIHSEKLAGKPDIVLPKYNAIIFVHGCFWHRHDNCKYAAMPKTNTEFWLNKFRQNVRRDLEVQDELRNQGWRVKTVWECEIRSNREVTFTNIVSWIITYDRSTS